MRFLWSALLVTLALLLLAGCSEDKKKEAAKLEKELTERQAETPESPESAATAVQDTAFVDTQAMSAGAIPTETQVPTPPQAKESGYVVQVASCESREYADYLVDKYQKRGYQPYVTTFDQDGQRFYRVRIGPYDSVSEANVVKRQIDDRFSVKAWVDYQS